MVSSCVENVQCFSYALSIIRVQVEASFGSCSLKRSTKDFAITQLSVDLFWRHFVAVFRRACFCKLGQFRKHPKNFHKQEMFEFVLINTVKWWSKFPVFSGILDFNTFLQLLSNLRFVAVVSFLFI